MIEKHQGMDPEAASLQESWEAAGGPPQYRRGDMEQSRATRLFDTLGLSDGPYCQGAKNAYVVLALGRGKGTPHLTSLPCLALQPSPAPSGL